MVMEIILSSTDLWWIVLNYSIKLLEWCKMLENVLVEAHLSVFWKGKPAIILVFCLNVFQLFSWWMLLILLLFFHCCLHQGNILESRYNSFFSVWFVEICQGFHITGIWRNFYLSSVKCEFVSAGIWGESHCTIRPESTCKIPWIFHSKNKVLIVSRPKLKI